MTPEPATTYPHPAKGSRKRRFNVSALLILLLTGAFIALLIYGLNSQGSDQGINSRLSEGRSAAVPELDLPLLQHGRLGPRLGSQLAPALADRRLTAAELRGQPVVLNFWASWCPPCRNEAPLLRRAWQRGRPQGVLVLGLDMQDVADDGRGFLREFRLDYPVVRDGTNNVAQKWGVTGLPETFFLSANGRVVGHVIGAISAGQLRDGIAAARSGRPAPALQGGDRRATR